MGVNCVTPPQVAVIIPFYQTVAGLLPRAVRSALSQTDVAVAVVVVDDGSPVDARAELAFLTAPERAQVTIIRQANAGPGASRNRGLSALPETVEYVAFLDSDDTWLPDHLGRALAAFAAGADLYFTDYRPLRSDRSTFDLCGFPPQPAGSDISAGEAIHTYSADLFDTLLRRSPIGTSTVVYRRSISDQSFPVEFSYGEDVFFWMLLARNSRKTMFSTRPGAVYGSGVNIAASASWGSPTILSKLHSEYLFHRTVARSFPLSADQLRWSRGYRRQIFQDFAANLLHSLLRGRRVDWRKTLDLFAVEAGRRVWALRVVASPGSR